MTSREKFVEAVAGIVELVQAQARGEASFMRPRGPTEVAEAITDLVPEHAWSGVVIPIGIVTLMDVREEQGLCRNCGLPGCTKKHPLGEFTFGACFGGDVIRPCDAEPSDKPAVKSEGCEGTHIHGKACP